MKNRKKCSDCREVTYHRKEQGRWICVHSDRHDGRNRKRRNDPDPASFTVLKRVDNSVISTVLEDKFGGTTRNGVWKAQNVDINEAKFLVDELDARAVHEETWIDVNGEYP